MKVQDHLLLDRGGDGARAQTHGSDLCTGCHDGDVIACPIWQPYNPPLSLRQRETCPSGHLSTLFISKSSSNLSHKDIFLTLDDVKDATEVKFGVYK